MKCMVHELFRKTVKHLTIACTGAALDPGSGAGPRGQLRGRSVRLGVLGDVVSSWS